MILMKYFIEGQSKREIARRTGFSRNTVKKYIEEHDKKLNKLAKGKSRKEIIALIEAIVEPPKYDSSSRKKIKLTEEIIEEIDILIKENKKRKVNGMRKQQRKKIDIYDYLVEKGYDISYSTICNHIRETYELSGKEAYIKQHYLPGKTLQFDYGELNLVINNKPTKLNLALFTTGYGFYHCGYLYKNKKMNSFLDAHVRAFESLKGVYHEVVYDNLKQAVKRFVGPNEKEATEDLIKISLYYGFKYRFCNPGKGNEKGKVERGVEFVRRKIFSQKTVFESLEEVEEYFQEKLNKLNSLSKKAKGNKSPVDLWQEEIPYLRPLKPSYETCIEKECRVNKYSFVTIEQNKYSVPDHLVGKFVISRIYLDQIKIFYREQLVAEHKRIYDLHKCSIDINHYLLTLKRKPGALKSSLAFHQMAPDLIQIYNLYYDNHTRKTKEFIELLELIQKNSLKDVKEVIKVLAKNKAAMVTTANIKLLLEKESTPDVHMEDEINKNSIELLKSWDTVFNLTKSQEAIH